MQTASSLTAKRKEAKLQKQAERLVKRTKRETHASFKTDRNRDSKVLNGRKLYCKKMMDAPLIDRDTLYTYLSEMWLRLGDMPYMTDPSTLTFFTLALNAYHILARMYAQPNMGKTVELCKVAYSALVTWLTDFDELESPQRRREVLSPLYTVCLCIADSYEHISQHLFEYLTNYTRAQQVCKKICITATVRQALLDEFIAVVNGKDVRQAAKASGLPYNEFRTDIIVWANHLYDIHTLVPNSPPASRPRSVPEVRVDWLQILLADNFKFLRGILLDAEGELRTLENKTGLSVFDWVAHESKILGVKL
nr:MAG TPA: hypothetical protein [Caudoviricetes sp.]